MLNRRNFLRLTGAAGAGALALKSNDIELVAQATRAVADRSPDDVAKDEFYWREIQNSFMLDRSLINLNNGNSCPSPTVVHEAYKRYLDSSNQAPVYHRGLIERNIEVARRRLAAEFGCDTEEMAITRNSSESLQIAQNGLDLEPGDEVLTTEQDYGRMLTTWDQRARRDKIKIVKINFPVPTTGEDLYARLEGAITPRTKVLHFCHITNLTGQIFPVQNICRMARSRGLITIVDGAHAVAHFPFQLRDLEMDYYGTSLHKWLLAPTGTGFLYVRKERIAKTWPLQAAPERRDTDIRKFEEIGNLAGGDQGGDQRSARLSSGDWRRAQGGTAPLSHTAMGQPVEAEPAHPDPHRPGSGVRRRLRRHQGHSRREDQRVHVGQVPHRHDGDSARRVQRHPRDAEHLHAARGDRYVRDGDGGFTEERAASLAGSGDLMRW